MSFRTLVDLGFGNWDGSLILLPEWVYPYIADGETLICISGETMVKGQDYIDQDTRGGWLAFGFKGPVDVL